MPKKVGNWYAYSGAIHIHTTESDGTKALEEVVRIGRNAGLDFMMFSDHMTLSNRERGLEGFYGDTLVVIGYEHNDTNDHHHYLLFESPGVYPADMSAAEYVAAGAGDGALGILAHPDEIRTALEEHPAYPWTDWSVDGFVGIELWNQMSEWMEKLTRYNKLMMSFSPRRSMEGPTDRILRKWDEINLSRKVVGLAGVDAHAFPIKAGPFTVEIFPYKVHFRCLRSHLLLPEKMSSNFDVARKQLYDAVRDCRLFFSNMRWGNADDFEFTAESPSQMVTCGGWLPSPDNVRLKTRLPERAHLKLVHNGQTIVECQADYLEFTDVRKGIYRVEAWKNGRGWIFSNHIRIGTQT